MLADPRGDSAELLLLPTLQLEYGPAQGGALESANASALGRASRCATPRVQVRRAPLAMLL